MKSENNLNVLSSLLDVISKGFNVSKEELEKTIKDYNIDFSEKGSENKESDNSNVKHAVNKTFTKCKNDSDLNNKIKSSSNIFSKCVTFDHIFSAECEKEMFEVLDACIFTMNSMPYKQSIVLFKYRDLTLVFKWNTQKDVYCLIYAESFDTRKIHEKIDNANLDLNDYNNDVISYYDQYSRSMKSCDVKSIIKNKTISPKEENKDINELLNKVEISKDLNCKTLFEECNKLRLNEAIKYLPQLYACLNNIFTYKDYMTYCDKVSNIDSIAFMTNRLYVKSENGSTICLFKIYTAKELEEIIKKRYQFTKVEVVREYDDQPLEDTKILCSLV